MKNVTSPAAIRFSSLLRHAATLYRIIKKSPQPPSDLTSRYLHSRKTLKPEEKRWISEITFSAIRAQSLAEYCVDCALTTIPKKIADPLKVKSSLDYCALTIISFCLLSERIGTTDSSMNSLFHAEETTESSSSSEKLNSIFSEVILDLTEIDLKNAEGFIQEIMRIFDELNEKVSSVLNNKGDLSDNDIELVSIRYAIPGWILREWNEHPMYYGNRFAVASLADSLLSSAPLCLRVNLHRKSREETLQELSKIGIEAVPALSPSGILLRQRARIVETDLFKHGIIEVQDEGSQLIGFAVNPQPHWRILDACAGAGGKSLHLADLQNDKGEIIAVDIEYKRLKGLQNRAARCGYHSIQTRLIPRQTRHGKGDKLPLMDLGYFDAVLVDAPCSGMGTVRRTPTIKWRVTPALVRKLAKRQLELLENYSFYVRKGGVLVYATCSLLPEENNGVMEEFLLIHPEFSPDPLKPVFASCGITNLSISNDAYTITLTPSEHSTDGFFIGRLRRQES